MAYKLLEQFGALFQGQAYMHRNSAQGDVVASFLFEDLFNLGRSMKFCDAVTAQTHVSNRKNTRVGTKQRRGDGTFGEKVPTVVAVLPPGLAVAIGELATIEIGTEVKIMSKAMIRQLDRVGSDLEKQLEAFKRHGDNPICVGIVGINRAKYYIGYEGDRTYPTTGKGSLKHPSQEAEEAERRLVDRVKAQFDEFLVLRFTASNAEPFKDFAWVNFKSTQSEYGAALLRIAREYDRRF